MSRSFSKIISHFCLNEIKAFNNIYMVYRVFLKKLMSRSIWVTTNPLQLMKKKLIKFVYFSFFINHINNSLVLLPHLGGGKFQTCYRFSLLVKQHIFTFFFLFLAINLNVLTCEIKALVSVVTKSSK